MTSSWIAVVEIFPFMYVFYLLLGTFATAQIITIVIFSCKKKTASKKKVISEKDDGSFLISHQVLLNQMQNGETGQNSKQQPSTPVPNEPVEPSNVKEEVSKLAIEKMDDEEVQKKAMENVLKQKRDKPSLANGKAKQEKSSPNNTSNSKFYRTNDGTRTTQNTKDEAPKSKLSVKKSQTTQNEEISKTKISGKIKEGSKTTQNTKEEKSKPSSKTGGSKTTQNTATKEEASSSKLSGKNDGKKGIQSKEVATGKTQTEASSTQKSKSKTMIRNKQ